MAKGSVRKKGKKWYYRFYVENESGNLVQKEYAGTESKSETEALLRKAMEDYEAKTFVARSENVTVGDLLDMWIEEEVKPGNLSNGTVMAYQGAVGRIKQFPIGSRKLKTVTSEHLQAFFDLLSFGGTNADGTEVKPISKGYMRQFSAVMQGAFRFAVFPKRLLTFNPMQYIKIRQKQESYELFNEDSEDGLTVPTISYEQFKALTDYLKKKDNPALLPIQIAYYTGLRIGEVCALTWQDIDLKEQTITVRRLYSLNYYKQVQEKGRSYYEVYSLQRSEEVPEDYREIDLVVERMEQNINIWDFELTEDEMKKIGEKDLGHSEIINHFDPQLVKMLNNMNIH